MDEFETTDEMFQASELIAKSDKSIFIFGSAGTGKTSFLKTIDEPNQVVISPTGIAALNAGGTTVHSFFKFSYKDTIQEAAELGRKRSGKKAHDIYNTVETIIIDEASMLRADLLDSIDIFLRNFTEDEAPFGGKRMIFVGDLFQLPPIEDREYRAINQIYKYKTPYFFSSKVINRLIVQEKFEMVELTNVFRQKDEGLINLLQKIRTKTLLVEDLELLNTRVSIDANEEDAKTFITPYRARAAEINIEKINAIKSDELIFKAGVTGKFENWQKPNEEKISLKLGCKVMALVNKKQTETKYEYVNGQMGIVKEAVYDKENDKNLVGVKVQFEGAKNLSTVLMNTWEINKFVVNDEEIVKETVATFTQLPLQVAYATTIHKSQGLTFNSLVFDLDKRPFGSGQTYVGLSRCKTLEGLTLTRPLELSDIRVDYRVTNFLKQYKMWQLSKGFED
jgi:ATP-dependent DNA helicase PIF1